MTELYWVSWQLPPSYVTELHSVFAIVFTGILIGFENSWKWACRVVRKATNCEIADQEWAVDSECASSLNINRRSVA